MLSFSAWWFLTGPANYCKINVEIDTAIPTSLSALGFHAGAEVNKMSRSNSKRIGWALAVLVWVWTGCMPKAPYTVAVAEEKAVGHCTYIDTISENSDMGAVQISPKFSYDARDKVLQRAEMVGATHVVWLADHPFGSSAMAYYCGN
jgi:hypothetical protein